MPVGLSVPIYNSVRELIGVLSTPTDLETVWYLSLCVHLFMGSDSVDVVVIYFEKFVEVIHFKINELTLV